MSRNRPAWHLPYGLRDGMMWTVKDVPAGLGCNCVCSNCGGRLVAKKRGEKRVAHFAHHRRVACAGGYESSIHRMAKQILVEADWVMLPKWKVDAASGRNPPEAWDEEGRRYCGQRVELPAARVTLTHVRAEVDMGDYRPDIVARDPHGDLLIEIRVTHSVDDDKAHKVRRDKQRMVEISLPTMRGVGGDLATLKWWILETTSNKRWISHPEGEALWQSSRDELERNVHAVASYTGDQVLGRLVTLWSSVVTWSRRTLSRLVGGSERRPKGRRLCCMQTQLSLPLRLFTQAQPRPPREKMALCKRHCGVPDASEQALALSFNKARCRSSSRFGVLHRSLARARALRCVNR